jgi:hypothetical protein
MIFRHFKRISILRMIAKNKKKLLNYLEKAPIFKEMKININQVS